MTCNVCNRTLDGSDCRPCAILICTWCRNKPDIFRLIRSRMFRHIDQHLAEGRKLDKTYPFNDLKERHAQLQ